MLTSVSHKIDDVYVVWFANGNQYIRLEEPAYFVFQRFENGISQEQIVGECVQRYHNTEKETVCFVSEIISGIKSIMKNPVKKANGDLTSLEITREFSPYSIHHYKINSKYLRFDFETRYYEHCLHPLLEHLETEDYPSQSIVFELFGYDEQIVLRVNGSIKGSWSKDETHLMKGMAFLQILNVVYEKSNNDWMAVIHASAVTNGEKTIVFTASPGSGKSTIAALLQQKGFMLVSDDFVAVERMSQHVFPFPAAMSVKDGATKILSEFFPSLKDEKGQQSITKKTVRYLPGNEDVFPSPVQEIFFIQYDPAIDFKIEKIPGADALKMLLDEAWTFPSAENAGQFLEWYKKIFFYRLKYSNNEKALNLITELFEQ